MGWGSSACPLMAVEADARSTSPGWSCLDYQVAKSIQNYYFSYVEFGKNVASFTCSFVKSTMSLQHDTNA